MSVTMESAVFMGTLKQMFDISTRLVSEQDEISGLETTGWEHHSWKYLSLIGDERVVSLQRTKGLRLFGFCIVRWEILNLTIHGSKD